MAKREKFDGNSDSFFSSRCERLFFPHVDQAEKEADNPGQFTLEDLDVICSRRSARKRSSKLDENER